MNSAATSALYLPTSFILNKNYLFKFVRSIVSKSITWISFIPLSANDFRISQPKPPAPITNTFTVGKASLSVYPRISLYKSLDSGLYVFKIEFIIY